MIQWYEMFKAVDTVPSITPSRTDRERKEVRGREKKRDVFKNILYLNL